MCSGDNVVTLGEGGTPVLPMPGMGKAYGIRELYILSLIHIFYDVRTASRLPVTGGDNQSHSPAWSVANQLAWLSPVGEGDDKADQVFILTEGKSVQFTHAKAGVVSFQWAPDGRGLYFLAPDPERKEELKRRNERYGDFAYIDKDYVWNCVYYQELPSGAAGSILDSGPKDLRRQEDRARKLVGDDGLHVLNYAVSPDNGRLAFMAASTPDSCLLYTSS